MYDSLLKMNRKACVASRMYGKAALVPSFGCNISSMDPPRRYRVEQVAGY